MNHLKKQWRKLTLAALLTGLPFLAFGAHADNPGVPSLLSEVKDKPAKVLPAKAIATSARSVKVNYGQLRSGRLSIDLPDGVSLDAVRDKQTEMGEGRFAWTGHADGKRANRVVLGVSGDAVSGSFTWEGRLFKLEPRPDGSHVVSEVEPGDPAPVSDPIPVADTTGTGTSAPATAADGGTVIDVLVAYTPAVQSRYGVQGAEALVVQAVAEANQAYANSGIVAQLNLVHATLTSYTESGSMNTDLSRLRSTSDGYMDELHALRNQYSADLVSLIEHENQYCGLAYRMASLSTSFASSAFSVIHHSCATGYYSFAHELGHNQGAHHDPDNASGAIYPYAYGHQQPAGNFRTVMAYNCSGGCTRVDHFSNPDILFNGYPTGVVGYADNALTLNTTAATVASFRQVSTVTPPAAPRELAAAAASYSAIGLNWVDGSADESGFKLERARDGGNFIEVASVPANTTAYLDENLEADTLYSYRVRAWNSEGNSAYSGAAIAATDAPPPIVENTATGDLPVAGSVNGGYENTWTDDGLLQIITERQSGGNKRNRYGFLEHKWTFQVLAGDAITLVTNVTADTQNDSFTFAYSRDNSSYTDLFTVFGSSAGIQYFPLPNDLSGTVYLRVRDNTRNRGEVTSHSVQVDHLMIRSENGAVMPVPTAPEGLYATAAGTDQIILDWLDTSDNEFGFNVERQRDGDSQWSLVATTGTNANSYTDTGLEAGTLYHYRVSAFNSAGTSGYSASDSAQTDEEAVQQVTTAAKIELNATGYKIKGGQTVDLTWTGATGASVDIYRDGSRLAGPVSNNGAYTDNIGRKGGGSYQYEICEAYSTTCSGIANVIF